jgi:predicted Rossmann fold nucleotide-binding protein DprA/Smf involved in DNA uptake
MQVHSLSPGNPSFPPALNQYLADKAQPTIAALGRSELLQENKIGLFCSVKCPGTAILRAFDLGRELAATGATVISGFHSPVEQEMLAQLLRGKGNAIICPARSLDKFRVPASWRNALTQGRMLLLSPFAGPARNRQTARLATLRNEFVATLADEIIIVHATPGGHTETLAREWAAKGKAIKTLG